MRVFLECEKAPRDEAPYDFSKGRVRFEYKYSGLHKRNQHVKKKPLSAPIKTWVFQDLMGDGGDKTFDFLILEGDDKEEARSYYFLIGFEEVSARGKTTYYVTVPASGGGRKRGFRGLSKRGESKFVWDHNLGKDSLKSEVNRLALVCEGTGDSAHVAGEADNLHGQSKFRQPPKLERRRKGKRSKVNLDSQLSIPFGSE
jgi:hypothetical protein